MEGSDDERLFTMLMDDNSSTVIQHTVANQIEYLVDGVTTDFIGISNGLRESANINLNSTGTHVKNFYENIHECSEEEYREHFRMSRSTMQVCKYSILLIF